MDLINKLIPIFTTSMIAVMVLLGAGMLWYIQPAHLPDIQIGSTLPIKIDPENRMVIFPAESLRWARQQWLREFREERFHQAITMPDKRTQARYDQAIPATARVIKMGRPYYSSSALLAPESEHSSGWFECFHSRSVFVLRFP